MGFFKFIFLLSLLWSFYSLGSSQLQASQVQVLLQLKKHLEYPQQLESWYDRKTSFCYLQATPSMNITCLSNSVSELNIFGDKSSEKSKNFEGFAISNVTLSDRFSIESFVTTLARLKSLRVLTLASLGIWGHLPEKLHRLSSLEYLDLSNNFLFGSVPPKLSTMVKLETFRFDHNFFNGTLPSWFDSYWNLKVLSFKSNKLLGELHPSLFSLWTIEYIDLSANSLSGSLPGDLKCGSKLWFIDISDNQLTGKLPRCLSSKKDLALRINGNCLSLAKQQHPLSFCVKEVHKEAAAEAEAEVEEEAENESGKSKWKKGALVGMIIGILMAILVLICCVFILLRRKGVTKKHLLHKTVQDNHSSIGFSSEILSNAISLLLNSTRATISLLWICSTLVTWVCKLVLDHKIGFVLGLYVSSNRERVTVRKMVKTRGELRKKKEAEDLKSNRRRGFESSGRRERESFDSGRRRRRRVRKSGGRRRREGFDSGGTRFDYWRKRRSRFKSGGRRRKGFETNYSGGFLSPKSNNGEEKEDRGGDNDIDGSGSISLESNKREEEEEETGEEDKEEETGVEEETGEKTRKEKDKGKKKKMREGRT